MSNIGAAKVPFAKHLLVLQTFVESVAMSIRHYGTFEKTPAHVAPHLVRDESWVDFTAKGNDPFLAAAKLHEGPGIVWFTDAYFNHPGWVIASHDALEKAYLDFEHFSSEGNSDFGELLGVTWKMIPLEIDPPLHGIYRRLLQPYFAPSQIARLREMVRAVCIELIAKFEHKGRCEFIGEFAALFPATIFVRLIGLPETDVAQFLEWESQFMRGPVAGRMVAAKATVRYLEDYLEQRRNEPPRDDIISLLIDGEVDGGRHLSNEEQIGTLYLMFTGGLDTVQSTLGWMLRYLASDPELWERLYRQPADIPKAVNELLRAFAVTGAHRTVAKDFEFKGVKMKAGDGVVMATYAAGRDPKVYADPHRIDIDRPPARSLTFATGPHNCIGIHLARQELSIVLEEFTSRFTDLRIPPEEVFTYHTGGVLGIDHMVLAWQSRT